MSVLFASTFSGFIKSGFVIMFIQTGSFGSGRFFHAAINVGLLMIYTVVPPCFIPCATVWDSRALRPY